MNGDNIYLEIKQILIAFRLVQDHVISIENIF